MGEVKGVVNEVDVLNDKEVQSHITTSSKLECKAFHYLHSLGIYHSDRRLKHLKDMSVAEYTIHFGGKFYLLVRCWVV